MSKGSIPDTAGFDSRSQRQDDDENVLDFEDAQNNHLQFDKPRKRSNDEFSF